MHLFFIITITNLAVNLVAHIVHSKACRVSLRLTLYHLHKLEQNIHLRLRLFFKDFQVILIVPDYLVIERVDQFFMWTFPYLRSQALPHFLHQFVLLHR